MSLVDRVAMHTQSMYINIQYVQIEEVVLSECIYESYNILHVQQVAIKNRWIQHSNMQTVAVGYIPACFDSVVVCMDILSVS